MDRPLSPPGPDPAGAFGMNRFPAPESLAERFRGPGAPTAEAFWTSVADLGTPLTDPDGCRVTFLWRDRAGTITTRSPRVHLTVNRVTDKARYAAGLMSAVAGTDIWALTLDLPPTLRASYGFTELPGEAATPPRPSHDHYPMFRDPFAAAPPLIAAPGGHGLSVFAGPLSPPQPEWSAGPDAPVAGTLLREHLPLPGDVIPERPCRLYLPRSSSSGRTVPLLTLFDGEVWFGRLGLAQALEAAVAAGRLPPVAVLSPENTGTADRRAVLGGNTGFLRAVAGPATAWAERAAGAHGLVLAGRERRIVAGQSLGGLSALTAAQHLHGHYAAAVCQSSSLWWTPGGTSSPQDLGTVEVDWVTGQAYRLPPRETRVLLDVGTREDHTLPRTLRLGQILRARGWDCTTHVYDGGHDLAWWRGALLDRLADILASPAGA